MGSPALTPARMRDLRVLQDRYDRKVAHIARTTSYYDEAPDGSEKKRWAMRTLTRLCDEKAEVERSMDELLK